MFTAVLHYRDVENKRRLACLLEVLFIVVETYVRGISPIECFAYVLTVEWIPICLDTQLQLII